MHEDSVSSDNSGEQILSGTVTVRDAGNGDFFIPIPDEVMKSAQVSIGDVFDIDIIGDKQLVLRKRN